MTKQEAIKSLIDTKVYVNGKSKEIQEKLFSLGIAWAGEENKQMVINTDCPFLFIERNGILKSNNMECFSKDSNKEVTANYILNLQWDEDKQAYNFKPFDRVLVRDDYNEEWHLSLFSHIGNAIEYPYVVITNEGWKHCIPYEGNEHLIGTADEPNN